MSYYAEQSVYEADQAWRHWQAEFTAYKTERVYHDDHYQWAKIQWAWKHFNDAYEIHFGERFDDSPEVRAANAAFASYQEQENYFLPMSLPPDEPALRILYYEASETLQKVKQTVIVIKDYWLLFKNRIEALCREICNAHDLYRPFQSGRLWLVASRFQVYTDELEVQRRQMCGLKLRSAVESTQATDDPME